MKKQPLFQKMVFPLLGVMLLQSLCMYAAVTINGTVDMLRGNAVKLLCQDVDKRYTTLENEMVDRWSDLSSARFMIQETIDTYLQEQQVSFDAVSSKNGMLEDICQPLTDNLLYIIRKNTVSGAYFILNNDAIETYPENAQQFAGLYYRDFDPASNPQDYSDILLRRGPASISGSMGIPLDSYWDYWVSYTPAERERMNFLFQPLFAAARNPSIEDTDLGYWSSEFAMDDEVYSVLSYSIPVRGTDGTCYGILGIEVSTETLAGLLPSNDLDENSRGGYALLTYSRSEQAEDQIFCSGRYFFGNRLKSDLSGKETITLIGDDSQANFYRLSEQTLLGEPAYASLRPLNLYNTNTPFVDQQWALVGIENQEALFGLSDKLQKSIVIAVGLSMLIGLAGIYIVALYVVRPLRSLMVQLDKSSPDGEIVLAPSRVREIDELADTIHRLSHEQHRIEEDLITERERYLLVLENTTESILEYHVASDVMTVYKLNTGDTLSRVEKTETPSYMTVLQRAIDQNAEGAYLYREFLSGRLPEPFTIRYLADAETATYQWASIKGRYIYDGAGQLIRVLGSVRDVTDEMTRELEAEENERLDAATGCYKDAAGESAFECYLAETPPYPYAVAIGYLHGMKETIRRYGVQYADLLLEDVVSLLRRRLPDKALLIRGGNVEFIFCMREQSSEDTARRLETICRELPALKVGDPDDGVSLRMEIGYVRVGSVYPYRELLRQAGMALGYAMAHCPGGTACLQNIDANDAACGRFQANKMTPIVYSYRKPGDIVNAAFNLFENSAHIKASITLLLRKLGRVFSLRRILVTSYDLDFGTGTRDYQWHQPELTPLPSSPQHHTKEEMQALAAHSAADETLLYAPGDDVSAIPAALYRDSSQHLFYCYSYENGRLGGCILFERDGEKPDFSPEEQKLLRELSKIIASQMSKSRSDLASQAKSEFLSRMSHEIRTPMNAIIGMTHIALMEPALSPQMKDYLSKIDTSTKYLLSLINDILDMSKIESGKLQLVKRPFRLSEIAEELEVLIRPQAEEKHIQFDVSYQVTEEGFLGDSLRINQVLINLLGNAVKFTGENGRILLDVRQMDHREDAAALRFSVSDNGIGISRENISRIFRAFEQAEQDTARRFGGTGLGLAISDRLLAMMDSRLEVKSELGKGTTFSFDLLLPVAAPEDLPVRSERRPPVHRQFRGERVLVVEDNGLNLEIAQTVLTMCGLQTEAAANGQEGLEKFAASEPGYYHLILMDISMPVMSGLEATRAIRRLERPDARTIPIIAMTANAFDEDTRKSIESGMNGHLSKPIDMERLGDILNQFILE